jgi:hypothetical protein
VVGIRRVANPAGVIRQKVTVTESATDPEPLHRVMGGGKVARDILIDEPYSVPIAGNVTKGHRREFTMVSGEMSEREFPAFNEAWRDVLPYLHGRPAWDPHRLARLPADETPRL